MKRLLWLLVGALVLILFIVGYGVAYRLAADRRQERFRRADVYVHIREFAHDWQVYFFAPAGYVEAWLIRRNPTPFLSQPSWADYPQVLLLEADQARSPSHPTPSNTRPRPNKALQPTAGAGGVPTELMR